MSNSHSMDTITLRSSNLRAFLYLALGLMSFAGGIVLLFNDIPFGWLFCFFAVPAVLLYRYNPYSTLMVTFGGISVVQFGHTSSFMWSDVEEFSVEKIQSRRLVVIRLSQTAIRRRIQKGICLKRVTDQEGDGRYIIPDNFGYRAEELRDFLKNSLTRLRR